MKKSNEINILFISLLMFLAFMVAKNPKDYSIWFNWNNVYDEIKNISFGPTVTYAGNVSVGNVNNLQVDSVTGALITNATSGGGGTVAQGTPATVSAPWSMVLTDGLGHTISSTYPLQTNASSASTVGQGTQGPITAPWAMVLSDGLGHTITTTFPLAVLQGLTTATSDSVAVQNVSGNSLNVIPAQTSGILNHVWVDNQGTITILSGNKTAANTYGLLAQCIPNPNILISPPMQASSLQCSPFGLKVDGTGVVQPVKGTISITGAALSYHYVSTATNNATNVKALPGAVFKVNAGNSNAAIRYLKLYDKASAPSCGSDTPKKTIIVPASSGNNISYIYGEPFINGIGFCIVVNLVDSDNTSVGTNDVVVDFDYN